MANDWKKQLAAIRKKLQELPKKVITKSLTDKIGNEVVKEMKDLISKGVSPIRGNGRFPQYKRRDDADGYPNTMRRKFPAKRKAPVNLFLSGDMLRALTFKPLSGNKLGLEVGYFAPEEAIKEKGHREGANTQPRRPTIPQGNEQFSIGIQNIIEDIVQDAVDVYVKKF